MRLIAILYLTKPHSRNFFSSINSSDFEPKFTLNCSTNGSPLLLTGDAFLLRDIFNPAAPFISFWISFGIRRDSVWNSAVITFSVRVGSSFGVVGRRRDTGFSFGRISSFCDLLSIADRTVCCPLAFDYICFLTLCWPDKLAHPTLFQTICSFSRTPRRLHCCLCSQSPLYRMRRPMPFEKMEKCWIENQIRPKKIYFCSPWVIPAVKNDTIR